MRDYNFRLKKLEKKKAVGGPLMAFVGVSDEATDVFDEAQKFWNTERVGHQNGNIRSALPWPSYQGKKTKFLGVGSQDDLYFGLCGGVRNPANSTFIFLGDVSDLIKTHHKEVRAVMDALEKDKGDLEVSEEAVKIIHCMVGSKER